MDTATHPARDRRAKTRLEDEKQYEISFKNHTTYKFTKKSTKSALQSSSKISKASKDQSLSHTSSESSKTSKQGTITIFLINLSNTSSIRPFSLLNPLENVRFLAPSKLHSQQNDQNWEI